MGKIKIDLAELPTEEREVIEARRAYKRAWNAANKERVKEYNRRFFEPKAAEQAQANKQA
ncbi:MAG: hypothetical protein ACI4JT_09855 [Oscillospiraceae bacterium]